MAYINEEEINKIRDSANIVDIINDYVPLKKNGNNYVGVCPFHDDHSPSMFVNPSLKIFKCFVCNVGGNVFSFVSKFENVSYPEAIKTVALKSGIDFTYEVGDNHDKLAEEFKIMDLSLKYYQNLLATEKGIEAKKYLLSRNIDDKMIERFKFGLSGSNTSLTDYLTKQNVNLDKAYDIGLLNKNGIDYYDMFVDRIMVPILDMQGRLCGYTARAYKKDEKNKYINSKETILYKKSNVLFNYYNAKNSARLKKEIIIVEGNMDALTLVNNGIDNVIALMGVVISKNQIDALKKLNSRVVLMLDSDEAGKNATLKVGDALNEVGIDLYVVRLSGAKDPDEYVRNFGVIKLEDNIQHARKYLDFKLDILKENRNLDNVVELSEYVNLVLETLKNASDLEREITLSKISQDYKIDVEVLKNNLPNQKKQEIPKPEIVLEKSPNKKSSRYDKAVSELIYSMLQNKDYYKLYEEKLGYLINKKERSTVALIGEYIENHGDIDLAGFIDAIIDYDEISEYINEIMTKISHDALEENKFYDILEFVNKLINEEEIKELKIKIKQEVDVAKKVELINLLAKKKREM